MDVLKPLYLLRFHGIPTFQLISSFKAHRDALGTHFKYFLGTLGSILVVWEGPGDRLEF